MHVVLVISVLTNFNLPRLYSSLRYIIPPLHEPEVPTVVLSIVEYSIISELPPDVVGFNVELIYTIPPVLYA